jgi:RNA polymerase sigma-70 factor (ECF subfamily)
MSTLTLQTKIARTVTPPVLPIGMDKDSDVFQKVQSGDQKAFEMLFRKYYVQLCHYAFKYVHNQADAEELVQDAFVYFWENRENISLSHSVHSYLYQSVKNKGLNKIRNEKRRRGHLEVIRNESTDVIEQESTFYAEELKEKLYAALEKLPDRCKLIFQMSRIEGLKHKEIADKLAIKSKTVENQIGIALKQLKKYLSDYKIISILLALLNL